MDVVMAAFLPICFARVQLTARLADRAAIWSDIAADKVIGTEARGVNPFSTIGDHAAYCDTVCWPRNLRANNSLKWGVRHPR